jgi:hypothetical protein
MLSKKTKGQIRPYVAIIIAMVLATISLVILLNHCSNMIKKYGPEVKKHIPIENGKIVIEIKESKKE